QCSPRLFMNASVRGVKRNLQTNSSPPCVMNSADIWRNPRKKPRPPKEVFMTKSHSDALVFFGATGDLAYKKIFPALQAMARRGHLTVPVVGVAKSGWTLDQLRARARDSVSKHGGLDPAAFDRLSGLLRYVDGDYADPATFGALRKQLGSAQRPAHYLAISPAFVGTVVV